MTKAVNEFEVCRQRTAAEEDAVLEAEWRRIGYPASVEIRRQNEALDAEYEAYVASQENGQ